MGTYKKGIRDEVSDTTLDTEAAHSIGTESLERFIGVDHNMGQLQEIAYSHLDSIVKWSADEWARAHAAKALQYLGQAEVLDSQNEGNVACGQVPPQAGQGPQSPSYWHSRIPASGGPQKLSTQLRISSPIPGTYCAFGLDQRPVDGVSVQHYERAGIEVVVDLGARRICYLFNGAYMHVTGRCCRTYVPSEMRNGQLNGC